MGSAAEESETQALLTLNFIINVVVDGVFCVFGFVGNILAIVALSKDKVKNSNVFFLQVLAVYDILFLIHTVLYTVLRSIYPGTGYLKAYYDISPYIVAFDLPFGWIAQTGTIWFTTLLAADRYLGITRPFKALTLCTLTNAKKATIGVSVFAFLFNFPRFFYYFQVALHSDNNSTFVAHVRVDLPGFDANIYRYVYHITLTFIFLYIIPLTALTVLNYKLINTLQVASKARKRMSISRDGAMAKSQNMIVTFNLVIVITKFILCETPDFISSIVGAIPAAANRTEYKMFNTIKEMLLVFNSAANFYIYCIFNVKFRENLLKVFPCCPKTNLKKDTRITASTNTINTSLSSISLAVTAFKGYKRKKGEANVLPSTAYRRKREQSESSTDVLEENYHQEPRLVESNARGRLLSNESQLTISTNIDSEPDTTLESHDNTYECENEDYLTFKHTGPTSLIWPRIPNQQHTVINNCDPRQIFGILSSVVPRVEDGLLSEGNSHEDTCPRQALQVSLNDDYLIFKSCLPTEQRPCLCAKQIQAHHPLRGGTTSIDTKNRMIGGSSDSNEKVTGQEINQHRVEPKVSDVVGSKCGYVNEALVPDDVDDTQSASSNIHEIPEKVHVKENVTDGQVKVNDGQSPQVTKKKTVRILDP